jgi:hypothetical protein
MREHEANREPDARRLIAAMRGDGVPLDETSVMDAVEHPRWEKTRGRRDWRAHVPRSLRHTWESLPLATRLCVFETAELTALEEEEGAVMVTGPANPGDVRP